MSFYAEEVFIKYLDLRRQLPLFANARSIKNIVNRACFRLASRVMVQTNVFTYKSLIDITPYDLILSTLFVKGLKTIPMSKVGSTQNKAVFAVSESADKTINFERSPKTFALFVWKNYA